MFLEDALGDACYREMHIVREGTKDLMLRDAITGKSISKVLVPLLDQELIYIIKVSLISHRKGYRYVCFATLFIPPAHIAAVDFIKEQNT